MMATDMWDDIHGIDAVDDDSDPMAPSDNSHGTHTAGIMGAVGDNGIGVTGVNWDVQIMALRAIPTNREFSISDVIELVNYTTMMRRDFGVNIVVSNNSYGGRSYSQAFYDAIKESNEAGIAFVASAGNSRRNLEQRPHYPASYDLPGVISVAATDKNDSVTFTNFGSESADLAAPGWAITSTANDAGYAVLNGTSMSAPMVAGAIAVDEKY